MLAEDGVTLLSKLRTRANAKFEDGLRIENYLGIDGSFTWQYIVSISNGDLTTILDLIDEMAGALETVEPKFSEHHDALAKYKEMME